MRRLWLGLIVGMLHLSLGLAQSDDARIQIALTAQPGDTLSQIARRYGVSVDTLLRQNSLDSSASLGVGQRLVIHFNRAGSATQAPTQQPDGADGALRLVAVNGGDAASKNAIKLQPRICLLFYADENQNGSQDAGESALSGGLFEMSQESGELIGRVESETNARCIDDLARQVYRVEALAPDGYGLTTSGQLRVDLRDGGPLRLGFGVALGFRWEEPPTLDSIAIESKTAPDEMSPLRELSGVFALGMAGLGLLVGLAVSMLLRRRGR